MSNAPFARVLAPCLLFAGAFSADAVGAIDRQQQGAVVKPAQDPKQQDPKQQDPKQRGEPPLDKHENRLARETSPYLRQHRHNPVDWYPWGEEALLRARREDKPIFLSIGYAACHWCHVMERESFEDPAIAKVLNELFVCIKVDREERPDLDEIYMTAVQAMGVPGGWPLSVWLSPDGKPFYGGTYFPPRDQHGRPGFQRVVEHLGKTWKERRGDVLRGSDELADHLQKVLAPAVEPGEPTKAVLDLLRQQSIDHYDEQHGGFAPGPHHAPKFPHASELQLLLALGARDGKALQVATHTLDRMLQGGIYDQLGGGFHRYSTDREWLVPHFEKMLYDNALLVPCYLDAYRLTGNAEYARIARETLDYLLREMRHAGGGFYSSQDADSEGVEGRFFVWQRSEFGALLGKDAELAARHWGVTEAGNWEHSNVLTLAEPAPKLATALQRPEAAVAATLAEARAKLLAARSQRVAPGTDDKILCAWNGMAIRAFAIGYQVLGDKRYLAAAQQAADFVLREMVEDGRCQRSWHSGRARHMGYLEDHAMLAQALLALFESDFAPRWLVAAKAVLAVIEQRFRDPETGGFWFTADDHEALLARSKSASEGSTPSGVAAAADAFVRAGLLLGDERLYDIGLGALRANHALLERAPVAAPSLTRVLQFHLAEPREVVIAGEESDPSTVALLAKVRRQFPDHHVLGLVGSGNRAELERLSPVFVGKVPVDGKPAAYVCRRGACEAPITDPERLFAR